MRLRKGKHGAFYSCERYPDCTFTQNCDRDGRPTGKPADNTLRRIRRDVFRMLKDATDAIAGRMILRTAIRMPAHTRQQTRESVEFQTRRHVEKLGRAWLGGELGIPEEVAFISNFTTTDCAKAAKLLSDAPIARLEQFIQDRQKSALDRPKRRA